ncbi:NF038122 family metalloprotease, partial [Bradyrhizobium diazoefficiens]|uniref:NF038122 family metalloprotease n=1 Tax=Bradyrhizobium diazoefficiens TaxID=1355477 RepID=UPI00190AF618
MTSTSTQDDLLSDDPFYTVVGNTIQGSYVPAGSGGATDGSTTGSVMSVTSGGITINLILDAAAQAAPASFKNGLQQAVAILAANITDKITVNIKIDYSGTGGGASAGPDNGYYENYSWVRSELLNNASAGDTTFNSLPSGSTIQGQSNVAAWYAQLKLWGVIAANDTTTDDASANFSTDINPNLLVGVALHELTHAMGRVPYGSAPDVFDFYRFTSAGVRLFSGGATAPAAYFSLDGGVTKLADYGRSSDPSDFLNSGVQGPNDPFNEYYTSSTLQGLTSIDLQQLDALGFHLAVNSPTTIEAFGLTSLVSAGSNYFLNPTAGGAGPSLKYGGVSVVVGQYSPLAPIGAEQVGSGYDVAWKAPGVDQYTVWSVDGTGNYLSTLDDAVSGTSYALESLETTFHQDLNGDGTIGVVKTVIESAGVTSLTQIANNYFLYHSGSGPELMRDGAAVVTNQFPPWAPIGAEQTSTGYDIAWKTPGTDQYTIWSVDSSGNYVNNLTGLVTGSSTTLES